MDFSVKIRALLATGGLLIGLAGLAALTWAVILALAPYLGMAGASGLVGALFTAGAGSALWLALRPSTPLEDELAGLKEMAEDTLTKVKDDTLDSLSGLPLAAATRMVDERPIAALLGIAAAAYTVTRNPGFSADILNQMIARKI